MAAIIVPQITAPATFEQVTDEQGRLVLLPAATVAHLRAQGITSVVVTLNLAPEQPPRRWLTVTEAAQLHMTDVDGLTLENAQVRITRACNAGRVHCDGKGAQRRIEPNSLDAWRLAERERNLSRHDAD